MGQARVSITPSDAWSDIRLTPLQCRLLGLIGSYLGKDHRAWPSQSTLAKQLCVSRKAVNQGVKALEKYGYIQVEKRHRPDGGQSSNCYLVVMDEVTRKQADPCNLEVTPPLLEGNTPCNPIEVTPPVTSEGYTHKKDPIERPKEEKGFSGKSALEEIWPHWSKAGRQRSKAKANLSKQLDALSKAHDLQDVVKACKAYAKGTAGEYHKGLHSFLSGGQWQNWIGRDMTPKAADSLEDWKEAARAYVALNVWPEALGPAPHEPECQAPRGLLVGILKQLGENHRRSQGIRHNIERNVA